MKCKTMQETSMIKPLILTKLLLPRREFLFVFAQRFYYLWFFCSKSEILSLRVSIFFVFSVLSPFNFSFSCKTRRNSINFETFCSLWKKLNGWVFVVMLKDATEWSQQHLTIRRWTGSACKKCSPWKACGARTVCDKCKERRACEACHACTAFGACKGAFN